MAGGGAGPPRAADDAVDQPAHAPEPQGPVVGGVGLSQPLAHRGGHPLHKQSYDFEDIRVLSYERLRNMAVLINAVAFFATVVLGTAGRTSKTSCGPITPHPENASAISHQPRPSYINSGVALEM